LRIVLRRDGRAIKKATTETLEQVRPKYLEVLGKNYQQQYSLNSEALSTVNNGYALETQIYTMDSIRGDFYRTSQCLMPTRLSHSCIFETAKRSDNG